MIPKKVYISVVVWDEGRKYDFLEVRERPYQTTDTQCHWREYTDLSSLWHDASEEPKGDEWHIAYIDVFGSIQSLKCPSVTFDTFPSLAEFAAGVGMQCWAYITDLLPKGGEK